MKARFNKCTAAISLLIFQIAFTGCQTTAYDPGASTHMSDLQPGGPAILATGSPEDIRRTAITDAHADIAANKPRIAITGGIVAWPIGVPDKYFKTVMKYPAVPLPCGCTSPWLKEAGIYAEAYNHEILPYLLKQSKIQQN